MKPGQLPWFFPLYFDLESIFYFSESKGLEPKKKKGTKTIYSLPPFQPQ